MKFIACGDMLFSSRNLAQRLDARLVKLLKSADVVFANAEFCTPERTTAPAIGRGFITSVRPETLKEFTELNIKMVNFAHNHTGDFGVQGVVDTLQAAEKYGIEALGIGYSLDDARRAHFADGKDARIGIVAAGATRSEVFAASNPGNGVAARPGSSPLRWKRAYVLPEKEFNELKAIDEMLGTALSRRTGEAVETYTPQAGDRFKFGSLYEGNLQIEKGGRAYVRTEADAEDEAALLVRIADAAKRSDFTLCTLHTHEGVNENWYAVEPPEFIESFAHKAIDAGASAFVGHGAHFMRGVEIYKDRPIFYNLGSLIMEFEPGESIICPEMFAAYGYDVNTMPSTLHGNRVKDKDGNFIGFASERRFSENALVVFDVREGGSFSFDIIPLDLDMRRDNPLKRGLPVVAGKKTAREIAEQLTLVSKKYGTQFVYDPITQKIKMK